MLDNITVEPRDQGHIIRRQDLVGGDHPWPARAGLLEILSGMDAVFLPVAHRPVVEGGEARNMIHGLIGRDAAPLPPDDDGYLGLVVETLVRPFWRDLKRGTMTNDRLPFLAEQDDVFRIGRGNAADRIGFAIVQADTDNLGRVGDRRQEFNLTQGDGGANGTVQRVQRICGQNGAKIGICFAEPVACRPHDCAIGNAVSRPPRVDENDKLHSSPPPNAASRCFSTATRTSLKGVGMPSSAPSFGTCPLMASSSDRRQAL